jgi:putative tryptophan/tyrosine transport system substrate-binding protein
VRKREFIAGLGAAAAWPVMARGQQAKLSLVGYLSTRSALTDAAMVAALRQGLAATGHFEGRNIEIEFRFADGESHRLPALASDLAGRQPAVIVAVGGDLSAAAVRAADAKIPVVFNVGFDPIQLGFVASFNRPGGNMTGAYVLNAELISKNLGLLHDLLPTATTVAMLQFSTTAELNAQWKIAHEVAVALGLRLIEFSVSTDQEIEAAFASMIERHADALLVPTQPFFLERAKNIVSLAAAHRLPAMYGRRNYVAAGGLISYGDDVAESYRQIGRYAGRILNGEKPADLPVVQTTKLELVINLATAKALGLTIPETLLATADEVIQ